MAPSGGVCTTLLVRVYTGRGRRGSHPPWSSALAAALACHRLWDRAMRSPDGFHPRPYLRRRASRSLQELAALASRMPSLRWPRASRQLPSGVDRNYAIIDCRSTYFRADGEHAAGGQSPSACEAGNSRQVGTAKWGQPPTRSVGGDCREGYSDLVAVPGALPQRPTPLRCPLA